MSEAQQTGLQSCYVDGVTITTIASCVSLLQGTTTTTLFGGVITTSFPEHVQTLPWDPGLFTGTLQLGKAPIAHGSLNTCTLSALNCWLTEVPIIIGSGMSIVGSGKVPGTGGGANPNFAEGTAIMPGLSFPAPLGAPTNPTLACQVGTGGTLVGGKTYQIAFVEVNNLDTNSGSGALPVPGLSAESTPAGVTCNGITCASNNCVITGSAPATLGGSGTIAAQDYRVFASTASGLAGSETLQVPGQGMTCTGTPQVDTKYGCQLGSNTFTITSITTGGDHPNIVDLSNPLVVEIGPVVGSLSPPPPTAHNEGFWARLENLTLALPASATTADPNVAFWNPSDQENSGLSFVGFTGQVASTTPAETGAWIYIGPHAPNSFVSNVQSDTNPTSGTFYGMILDGRSGFGTSGTARVVYNSTFTPGRCSTCSPTIKAAALVAGGVADVDFVDDHFEVTTGDCIQVVTAASVSVQGNGHFCSPVIRLCSSSDNCANSTVAGNDISVRNVSTTPAASTVVQDDVNGVTLSAHVSDYSTAVTSASITVGGPTTVGATILPPTSGTPTLTLPTSGGTIPSSATSPITLSTAGAIGLTTPLSVANGGTGVATASANNVFAGPSSGSAAAPAFRALVAADLPTGGTVQVLGAAQANVTPGSTIYVPWLGGASGAFNGEAALIASNATIAGLFVGVGSAYGTGNGATFTVASCTPSGMVNCTTMPTDSPLKCTISGTTQTQCNDTTDSLNVLQGDQVFLHVTVSSGTPGTRTAYMSYRLKAVQ